MNIVVNRSSIASISKEYTWEEVKKTAGIYVPISSASTDSRLISFSPFTTNQAIIYILGSGACAASDHAWQSFKFHKVSGETITLEIKNES